MGKKTYRYALTVVDVASRFKVAEPLISKTASEVADSLEKIYKCGPLTWPKLLQLDLGHEFMGAVTPMLAKHGVQVRRGPPDLHRDRGSSNAGTGHWLSGSLDISTLLNFGSPKVSTRPSG